MVRPGNSPFAVNRVVAVVAVSIALVVIVGGIILMTGNTSKPVNTIAGSLPPPVGAPSNAKPTTVDPLAVVTTTTAAGGLRACDSPTSLHSVDGKNYTPCTGGFAIDFPAKPDIRTTEATMVIGKVAVQTLTSTDRAIEPFIRYQILWATLPKEPTEDEAKDAQNVLMVSLGATPGKDIEFQGQPAMAFKGTESATSARPLPFEGFTFVRGTHVYAILAYSFTRPTKYLEKFSLVFAEA